MEVLTGFSGDIVLGTDIIHSFHAHLVLGNHDVCSAWGGHLSSAIASPT